MKKAYVMMAISGILFAGGITAISADMKAVPEGSETYLTYGYATTKDTRTDHSYNYQTNGTCTGITNSYVAVYVKDSNGVTRSSDSCGKGRSCEATWFSSGKVSHIHQAGSGLMQI